MLFLIKMIASKHNLETVESQHNAFFNFHVKRSVGKKWVGGFSRGIKDNIITY